MSIKIHWESWFSEYTQNLPIYCHFRLNCILFLWLSVSYNNLWEKKNCIKVSFFFETLEWQSLAYIRCTINTLLNFRLNHQTIDQIFLSIYWLKVIRTLIKELHIMYFLGKKSLHQESRWVDVCLLDLYWEEKSIVAWNKWLED